MHSPQWRLSHDSACRDWHDSRWTSPANISWPEANITKKHVTCMFYSPVLPMDQTSLGVVPKLCCGQNTLRTVTSHSTKGVGIIKQNMSLVFLIFSLNLNRGLACFGALFSYYLPLYQSKISYCWLLNVNIAKLSTIENVLFKQTNRKLTVWRITCLTNIKLGNPSYHGKVTSIVKYSSDWINSLFVKLHPCQRGKDVWDLQVFYYF